MQQNFFEKYITIHLFISINVIRHVLSLKTTRKYAYIRRRVYGGWDSTVNSFNNFISKVLTTVITKFTVQITQFKLNRLLSSSLAIYLRQLFQMPMHINRVEKHWRIAARGNRTDRSTRISSNRRSVLCYFTKTCSYEKKPLANIESMTRKHNMRHIWCVPLSLSRYSNRWAVMVGRNKTLSKAP